MRVVRSQMCQSNIVLVAEIYHDFRFESLSIICYQLPGAPESGTNVVHKETYNDFLYGIPSGDRLYPFCEVISSH